MGDSHFSSNVKAGGSAVTISGFSSVTATTFSATTSVAAPVVTNTSYIKLGSHQYLLYGGLGVDASIVAVATAIDASCQGSMYLSSQGKVYYFNSDTAATTFAST